MSLFERLKNKRYELQEVKKKFSPKGQGELFPDPWESGSSSNNTSTSTENPPKNENSKPRKIKKKLSKPTGRGFEDITGEGNVKPPKTRKELIAKRKEYGINKDGVPSKEGIKRYAEKAKQLKSGSNVPVNVTQDDLYKAKERMVGGKKITDKSGKVIGTTTGRYGGRLADKDPKIAKMTDAQKAENIAKIKAKIDAKNPVIQTPVGPLPKTAKNMKKFSKRTRFKNFASKQGDKAFKYLKGVAGRNKLATAAIGLGALYFGGQQIKKALGPKTLTNKDFTSTAPIKDRSGQNVRFKYDKKAENMASPYLGSKTRTRSDGTKIPSALTKFKTGAYNVATKSGKPINVNQNMKQSAFEKQLQKAEKNTIRKLFGISIDKNSVHGSDSKENAEKEINFFFKD